MVNRGSYTDMGFKPLKQAQQVAPKRFKPIQQREATKASGFKPVTSLPGLAVSQPVQPPQQPKQEPQSLWKKVGNQLIKPVASASNLLEDTGKGIAAAGIAALTPATFGEVAKKIGFKPIQNQRDVWSGKNQRTYSTIMNEVASKESNPVLRGMQRTIGYGADFILDPLNKVKILEATAKGREAMKTGGMALSAADQAAKGQRALLQFGNTNILPSVGNRILALGTKANDAIRGTKYGAGAIDALAKVSTSIRPSGVSRGEFKTIQDATRAFKKSSEYASKKAIEGAAEVEKLLRKSGADGATRSALLHAVEKGDSSLVPQGLEEAFQKSSEIKATNEKLWTEAGGATLENYGLPHVATDAVKEAQPTTNLRGGGKIYSPATGQDIHRQWVKVDGEVKNLATEGIKFNKKTGQYLRGKTPVSVTQATAKEINEALVKQGKEGVFKEDLPTSLAIGGISSGRKAAGETFIKATKDKIKSDKGLQIIDETYQRLTNNEAVGKALKAYDKVLGLWKAQVLVAPSYHVRNEVGNVWNNFLAGTSPVDYITAAKMQSGKLDDAGKILMKEMEEQGVTGGAQYGRDITQTISDEIGGKSWNPLSQRFGLYKGNRTLGTAFEDNARIAHYLSKRREGFSPVEAAKSVDKFLFDYGDLTFIEQNVLKRAIPFYTWASKNIPLQLEQFVKNPGKFSKAAIAQKDVEDTVSKPNERYMSEYVKNNSPMRIRTNEDGTTEYLLLGQWIPAAQAIQFLSQPKDEILRGISPMVTIPSDLINNRSFFKDTLGDEQPIERTPGELGSFLGFDMRKKLINVLRGIRVLNEIDKLNPGEIFGGKGNPSVFQGLTDNASETRGLQHSPDSTQSARTLGFLLGKTSTYDPESAKIYYDRDTQDRMNEYTSQLNNALRLGQPDLAAKILKEMEQFNLEREGKKNKNIEGYNLMGDRYFEDLAKNKQAEYNRTDTRTKMKEMIRQAVNSNDTNLLQEALKLDPTYASQAMKDAMKEKVQGNLPEAVKKQLYEIEQRKTQKRLNTFYTK